jgi:peptidoglycan/xylan/chitin deacetylase (PgdA/CDA1 family)
MSVSRAKFLQTLGKSIPGLAMGGTAAAAQALAEKLATISGPIAQPAVAPLKSGGMEFLRHGPSDGNRIALTFDDGPTPGVTDRILDELKRRDLRATFFMIGQKVAAAPELARRVLAEGHEIGNHSFTHPKLAELPDTRVVEEIEKTQAIMHEVLYHHPTWFRPPFGSFRREQTGILQRENLRLVMWSVDPKDWSQPGESKIAETILTNTKSGSIILCHDLYPQTVNAVGKILEGLTARGFSFVTLSTLLANVAFSSEKIDS